MSDIDELKTKVKVKIRRIKKARREQGDFYAQTVYLGTLGCLIIFPILIGTYLGLWLDRKFESYVFTGAFIILGAFTGAITVYLYIRDKTVD